MLCVSRLLNSVVAKINKTALSKQALPELLAELDKMAEAVTNDDYLGHYVEKEGLKKWLREDESFYVNMEPSVQELLRVLKVDSSFVERSVKEIVSDVTAQLNQKIHEWVKANQDKLAAILTK